MVITEVFLPLFLKLFALGIFFLTWMYIVLLSEAVVLEAAERELMTATPP